MNEYNGRVAIITGASSKRGIGWATAVALSEVGMSVAVADIDVDGVNQLAREIVERGGKAIAVAADVSKRADVANLVSQTASKLGTPGVLVNNAGITQSITFSEIKEEEWDRMLSINLKSCYLCSQEVLPYMKQQRWGRIVCVSSMVARNGGGFGASHYAASKAGMIGMVRALAREVAPDNITVNAVTPGSIDTDILKNKTATRGGKDVDAYQKERIALTPLGRLAGADVIADAIAYLATKANFTTGAVLDINGGRFIG